jgi:hypothetical protein
VGPGGGVPRHLDLEGLLHLLASGHVEVPLDGVGVSQETGWPPSVTLKETGPWKPFWEVKVRVRVTVSPWTTVGF